MDRVPGTPRYAHAEGHTDISFSEDGEYIITCGSDGDVRMYKGIEDDDVPAKCVGEKAFAVVQKGGKLYVGSDHNYVQTLTFPDGELDGILTRFTAPVNTIDVCKDGTFVAAGSSDSEIRVIDVTNSVIKYFSGHKAPILRVALDPKKEYLASSSCDGTVRIWKIEDEKMVKEWVDVVKPCNSFHNSESLCGISWESSTGRLLAIPFPNEVRLVQRSTWNTLVTLPKSNAENFSLTAWSSCGRYLAATTVHGHVFVWNTLINKQISSYGDKSNINICAIQWHPNSDARQIAYCDVQGQLSMLENCFQSNSGNQSKPISNKINAEPESMYNVDDDDPDAISLEKIKADFSYLDDDINGSMKGDDDDASSVKSASSRGGGRPMLAVDLQPTFQPTSTPVHLQRRFMVFNDIGYVRQTNTEEENMIDIDFHDVSIHHAFRLNNLLNHTKAALNSEALVLASEKNEDSTSKLFCRVFKSWDGKKEWNTEMPSNENIDAIAVGLKWIAVVTSSRILRLFTLSGVQREIICVPGLIVSMNASEDLLILVYHSSMGLPGEQNLCFAVYQITYDVRVLVAAQPLPLMPKSTLKWVGFSDQLNPCILDSDGSLKLFSSNSGFWKPICLVDAQAKDFSDHYFVIGISEERQNIRCILCKGSFYPSTTPHPFITEIPWQIPVCDLSMDKGILEEKFWRCSIAKEFLSKEDKKLNKEFLTTALKLFQLSCQTSHDMRVLELCDVANQADIIELALKYASKFKNELLLDKLTDLQTEQKKRSEAANNIPELNEGYNGFDSYKSSDSDGYGRRYLNNENESQELFPSSASTNSSMNVIQDADVCSSETLNGGTFSLIAETNRKKNLNEQRLTLPSRKINPFKKFTNETATAPTTRVIDYKDENLDRTFVEWFKIEKENLLQEFSGLEEAELRKEAMKKFRELKDNRVSSAQNESSLVEEKTNEDSITEDEKSNAEDKNSNRKRKLMGDQSSTITKDTGIQKKKPLLKLQDFKFTKN